ncbi:MAG: response regulator [Flavobacteriales bacterium]|nr:response regulator [Flavobacteriales bacterium]
MNKAKSKILVFDDDKDLCHMLSIILKRHFDVIVKHRVSEAISDIRENKPDFILMDLNIPDIGGEETAKTVKRTDKLKDIPLYLFSANSDILNSVKRSNADGYIKKPCDKKILIESIRAALQA